MTKANAIATLLAYGEDDGPETYDEAAELFAALFGRQPDASDGNAAELFSHACAAAAAALRSAEDVAELVGLTPGDECDPDGIDWGSDEPAAGAPVFLVDGYWADDGNCEVHFPDAESGQEAAQEYAEGGDWDLSSGTIYIHVGTWQECRSVNAKGEVITGTYGRDSHTVTLQPPEPSCVDDGEHDWQSPHEIVGGIEDNPGVWGNGGGVLIHEVCMRCACGKTTNTWAQDPETGEQGLTSVSYEPGEYTEALERFTEDD